MAIAAAAALWLVTLLVAFLLPVRRAKGKLQPMRKADLAVLVTGVPFAALWFYALLAGRAPAPVAVQASLTGASAKSCALIGVGDSEAKVREKLGTADEIRGEEEQRGPGANVWIYRNSRCAVHLLDGSVESIE
jgi:hypothetical protein